MGHFAKVIDGGVAQVIVAEQEFIDTYDDGQPTALAWVADVDVQIAALQAQRV